MIRVHTFIKYGRIQLQEAEAALQEDRPDICCQRLADLADSLSKAIAAALPTVKKDFLTMEPDAIARYAADLAEHPEEAREAAAIIGELRKLRKAFSAPDGQGARMAAERACSSAGRAFTIIHGFFA